MTVWLVFDGDYDDSWVVAAYDSEPVARDHAATYGLHRVEAVEVLSGLTAEAADPALRAQREADRLLKEEQSRARYLEEQERARAQAEWRATITIEDVLGRGDMPGLCSCPTFSDSAHFISPHGYCGYCGKWTHTVYRAACGEAALVWAIGELESWARVKMRAICGLETVRGHG